MMKGMTQTCTAHLTCQLTALLLLLALQSEALAGTEKPVDMDTSSLSGKPIRLGLLPYLTPSVLVKKFTPLKEYLQTSLARPVQINTAPDFATYIQRVRDGHYDVFLAAPHISAYMEKHYRAKRLACFSRHLNGFFVVHKDSEIKTLDDLVNRQLAMPDRLAIISLLGEATLLHHDIDPGRDIIAHHTTHNNALLLVAARRQDAAIVGVSSFDSAPLPVRNKLRVLSKTLRVPHMMFQSRADLDEKEYVKIKQAMLSFTAGGAGQRFFQEAAFGDMIPIADAEMRELDGLAQLLAAKLEQ